MGVPAFYRWLSEKYPKIVQDVLEERVALAGDSSTRLPFDATKPNPSGIECDNLYIDMNGIIHPCSHPENGPQPQSEEEMYENVCRYVDRLFRAIRPRQLLYLAIDGVAPRAKMNQQRARRFRSAQEARELKDLEEEVRKDLELRGHKTPPIKDAWDSNVITPGTTFMLRLADYIRFYIRKRISQDKAWKQIRVIFSDASIPGEGEHKIMSHIRLQRAQPSYNPNTVHVLHGLDADLIMLALATHEPHFYICREEVLFGRKSLEQQERRQEETGFRQQQKALDEAVGDFAMSLPENSGKPLQRISIPILREYLAAEFAPCLNQQRLGFAPSLERLIDDIVFLCFFVGNDFLPHLPSLDIRDGALDFLFNVYKRILPSLGDYITRSGGNVNLSHVDVLLAEVGTIEDYVFSMKHENEMREEQRRRENKERQKRGQKNDAPPTVTPVIPKHNVRGRAAKILERQEQAKNTHSKVKSMDEDENIKAAQMLKDALGDVKKDVTVKIEEIGVKNEQDEGSIKVEEEEEESKTGSGVKRKRESVGEVGDVEEEFDVEDDDVDDEIEEDTVKVEDIIVSDDPEVAKAFKERVKTIQQKQLDEYSKSVDDKVRLHEAGWRDRYYKDKCKADDVAAHGGRENLFRSYVVGLCWVMKYYYDGCPSWKWYYPFHYAPFASDLKNIERFEKDCKALELSKPFNPVEQLMAVLPSDSVHAIPRAARWLMTDEESPIIDFYPKDVPVDPNGKAMPWLWVVLLPFIDEDRLLTALSPTMTKWTKEELLCNARGLDDGYVYVHRNHPLSQKLAIVLKSGNSAKSPKTRLGDTLIYGCKGFTGSVRPPLSNELWTVEEDHVIPPPPSAGRIDRSSKDGLFSDALEPNEAICVAFTEPPKLSHKSILLPGARPPSPILLPEDKQIRRPRLNRGGGTIANLGGSNGRSDHSGFGSMNIGSYERDLANRTGRGNEMYQPGTRAWGAMEPVPKQRRMNGHADSRGFPPPPPAQIPNPLMRQPQRGPPIRQGLGPPVWQQQHRLPPQGQQMGRQEYIPNGGHPNQGPHYQHHGSMSQYGGQGVPPPPPPPPPHIQGGHYGGQNQRGPPHAPPNQQNRSEGFSFRSHPQGPHYGASPQQRQAHPNSRANESVMNNLRAQLTNTLQQHRKPDGSNRR